MDISLFEARKKDHIRHSLNPEHQTLSHSGLDSISLPHDALPELNFDEISITTTSLGLALKTPFFIAGMTAGHDQAWKINERLAQDCEAHGWSLGLGSLRREFEDSKAFESLLPRWKDFRTQFPQLHCVANLGISQLIQLPFSQILLRLEQLHATLKPDALAIHLNALQEALQPEGTPQFKGGLAALKRLTQECPLPIVLKETGCGFSEKTLHKISTLPLLAIDISGLGGTHWGRIEGARAPQTSLQEQAAQTFSTWGVPTVDSTMNARKILPTTIEIWASGGVRSGLDAAKLISLGASRVGYAQPALQATLLELEGQPQALSRWMKQQEFELKTALFCSGHPTPLALQTLHTLR